VSDVQPAGVATVQADPSPREEAHVHRRAMAYFTPDWPLIAILVVLIGMSVTVGILEAWPLAVLIDSVLTDQPKGDWIHALFLSVLPDTKIGQIIGLVIIGMGLQLVGYFVWMARMMINYHLEYRGTTRVRYDLFHKLQHLGMTYHKSRPQGDAIYRLSADAFGPWGIVDVIIGTSVAAITLTVMTAIMLSRNVPLTLAASRSLRSWCGATGASACAFITGPSNRSRSTPT
jgi:ATP-binding cassette, subfamily B, bacterial